MEANYEDVRSIIEPLGLSSNKAKNIIGENISTSSKKSLVHSLENRIVVRDRRNRNNNDF